MAEKKVTVEVFKDRNYPELDSDDVAHALATIEVIKPFVEIINRNRKLQLGESQGIRELDVSKRVRVALQSDGGVLYTGRDIINADQDSRRTSGIFLGSSKLCVVNSNSASIVRTARHELGHFLHGYGRVIGKTVDEVTDHCSRPDCVMYEELISEKRRIIPGMGRRAAEALGLRIKQYEHIVDSLDFCPDCDESMGKSAFVMTLLKQNYLPLAAEVQRAFSTK